MGICLVPVLCSADAALQEESRYPASKTWAAFLSCAPGARSVGMGEAFTAVADDISAISSNPAGLGRLKSWGALLVLDNWASVDTALDYVALAVPTRYGTFGIGLYVASYGSYDLRDSTGVKTGSEDLGDSAVTFAWGIRHPSWGGRQGWSGLGVERVDDAAGQSVTAVSVGSIIAVRAFDVGLAVQHLGPKVNGVAIPSVAKVGAAYGVLPWLRPAMDVGYGLADGRLWASVGCEGRSEYIQARLGYRQQLVAKGDDTWSGVSLGIGITADKYGLDYAYQPFGSLTAYHRFSLSYGGRP
jgi:hypothetical protein